MNAQPPFVQKSIDRLEALLAEAEKLETHENVSYHTERRPSVRGFGMEHVQVPRHYQTYSESPELTLRIRHAVSQVAPNSLFERQMKEGMIAMELKPVLKALIDELKGGTLNDSHDVAHAEVFNDLLNMARYLLGKSYKIAAAVIAGSSAEAHLRQLAAKNGVITTNAHGDPLNGGALNDELARSKVYDVTTQKLMLAWQGIRNDAAHGKKTNDELDAAQIQGMIGGIQDFILKNPD